MDNAILDYYSNIEPKEVKWLWYPYIPYGKLSVIQGDPGEGKSTLVISLVARLTNGQPMPDGYEINEAGIAIYQCAEDVMADTIKPRLQQAGADCSKVAYIVENDIALTLEDGRIETAVKETGAKLLIIDPLQAFIPPDTDMQSAIKMRMLLRNLARIADSYGCAVLLVGHMNKGNSGKALYRGLGSIDIAAIARSIMMVSRDEAHPEIRYLCPIKSSLAPEGKAIAFTFKEGGGIEWKGKYSINSSSLVETVTVKLSKKDKAKTLLVQILEQGDKSAKEIYAELASAGVQSRTVEMVKKELGITTYRSGGCWYWKLPKRF